MLKAILLGSTKLRFGVAMSAFVGTVIIFVSYLAGVIFGKPYTGAGVGAFFGLYLGAMFYNYGLYHTEARNRSVLKWFGDLLPGSQYEVGAGDIWIFRLFNAVGVDTYPTMQETLLLDKIQVETKNDITLPIWIAVQFTPQEGALYWYGNLSDVKGSLYNVAKAAARSHAVKCESLNELLDNADKLEEAVTKALREVSLGSPSTDPWGINIQLVKLADYEPPKNITDAAAETEEAEKKAEAAKRRLSIVIDAIEALKKAGVDPNIASVQASSIGLQESGQVSGNVIAGLEASARALGQGLGAGFAARK